MTKAKNILIITSCAFRLLLDYCYKYAISPIYSYAGFEYIPNKESYIISWVVLLLFIMLVQPFIKIGNTFVGMFALIIYFVRFIPITSFYACYYQPIDCFLLNSIFYAVLFVFLYFFLFRFRGDYNVVKSSNMVFIVVMILALNIVFISGYYSHFRLNFSLTNVYDLRFEARDYNIPLLLKYLWNAGNNIIPIFVVYYLEKKKKIIAYLLIFVSLLNFGINGLKTTLFKVILCVILYKCYRRSFVNYVGLFLVILVSFALMWFYFLNDTIISDIIVRRVFFMPARLDFCFYEYTLQNGLVYMNSELADKLTFDIGAIYMHEGVRANNGMFSDAYARFGIMGVFFYPILISLFCAWCGKAINRLNESIKFYVALIFAVTLMGSAFTTCLLTHGLMLTVVVLMMLPKTQTIKKSINS